MSVRVLPEVFRNSARISLRNGQLVGVMFFFVLSLSNLFAQSDKAILSGTLVGPSGSPVPDVRISLLWNDVGSRRQSTSDDNGFFIIPALTPGSYTLQAYRDGFVLVQISKIILAPDDHRNLQISFQLKPIHETVSVSSDDGVAFSTVATKIDQHLVEDLPLRGGSFPALFLLTPGIAMLPGTDQSKNDHPFSFNGQSTDANYFTVDGVSAATDLGLTYAGEGSIQSGSLGQNAGYSALGTTINFLPANSLAEINVQTATYAPATGRQAGGHVEMASRSGTSEFHGMLSESFRNSALDARDWFTPAGAPKAPLHMNDFSGSTGGPLWPYEQRNWHNYFFLAYEGVRLETPTVQEFYLPSLRLRNAAPTDLKPYLNAFPLPNGPEEPGTGTALYQSSFSLPSQGDAYSLRIDNVAGNRFTGFVHYSNSPSSITAIDPGGGVDLATTNVRVQALTTGGTWVAAWHGVDTFRANYSWNNGSTVSTLRNADGAVIPANNVLFPAPSLDTGGTAASYIFLGSSYTVGAPSKNVARQQNVVNDITFTAGQHTLSFGFDYLRFKFEPVPIDALDVFFSSLGSVSLGDADVLSLSSQDGTRIAQGNLSLYAQDSWQATERLKLSYGLRWEINPSPHDLDGQQLYSITVSDTSKIDLPNGRTPLYKTHYTDFAPRVGLAYAIRKASGHELLIHAGAGIFYSLGNSNSLQALSAFPHARLSGFYDAPFPGSVPLVPPFIAPALSPPFDSEYFVGYTPHYAEPQLYQWSAGLEQSLSTTQQILITYVGSSGHRLYSQQFLDDPDSDFIDNSIVQVSRSDAISSYNSLQLQYKHRLSKGFEALASYTWAHSLDNASSDIGAFSNTSLGSLATERGNSNFDLRNSFGMALTYEISLPEEKTRWGALFNHWDLSTLALAHGAVPVDVVYTSYVGNQTAVARPDVVLNQPDYLKHLGLPGGKAINPNAFSVPAEQRQGTLGRNSVRGFPFWQLDLAVSRNIQLSNKVRLQWRGEFFNLFNHPNFGDPSPYLSYKDASGGITPYVFGQSTSMLNASLSGGGAQKEFQIGGARSVQLGLKLSF